MTYFPPLVPGGARLAVRQRADILAQLPEWMKRSDVRPVTDALADALLSILLECQYRGSYAAAQSDIARATDRYLEELTGERGFTRATGETQADYRERVLEAKQGATLGAIRAAVNGILARYTTSACQVIEPALDRWFVCASPSSATWHGCVGAGISPSYPTRLYESEASRNGGEYIAHAEPVGARAFSDRKGRYFMVIVPRMDGIETDAYVWNYTGVRPPWGLFVSAQNGASVTVTDGDMEAAGTTAWTASHSWLGKVAGAPNGEGAQVLQIIASDTHQNVWAAQALTMDLNAQYRVRGWFRSQDGVGLPAVSLGQSGGAYLEGTASTDWQQFDLIGYATSADIYLRNIAETQYSIVEFDEVAIVEHATPARRGFVNIQSSQASAIYRAIEDTVDALAGHSFRWSMLTSEHL